MRPETCTSSDAVGTAGKRVRSLLSRGNQPRWTKMARGGPLAESSKSGVSTKNPGRPLICLFSRKTVASAIHRPCKRTGRWKLSCAWSVVVGSPSCCRTGQRPRSSRAFWRRVFCSARSSCQTPSRAVSNTISKVATSTTAARHEKRLRFKLTPREGAQERAALRLRRHQRHSRAGGIPVGADKRCGRCTTGHCLDSRLRGNDGEFQAVMSMGR